jgi:prevent-host-death family protein
MKKPDDVRPLTEFQRNTKSVLRDMQRTGRASVLTVNGRRAAVVLNPQAYDRLVSLAETAVLGAELKKSLDDVRQGKGISLEDFEARMLSKLTTARRRRRSA